MHKRPHALAWLPLLTMWGASAASLPLAQSQLDIVLPDYGAEIRAFNDPLAEPVEWTQYVVNAGFGDGRGAPERWKGWLAKNWKLMDYMDRSGDYVSHRWLEHRGIWCEVYGSNEYQETIHFHEKGARELFWDNGIARDMTGERTLSQHYNTSHEWWKKKVGWDAFIVCNNAPRWSAVINYDLLTSPALGSAMSQDNIGGPTSRIGVGSHGRYCDQCNAKFFHHLRTTGRLPEFRQQYRHIRDYVQANLMDLMRQLPPYNRKDRFSEVEAERISRICDDPVMAEYQKFLYLSHIHNLARYYRDQKVVAKRLGKHYSVHGNQGGGFMGPNAYQIALSDFVDTVWFESAGMSAYDMFKYHWYNAWGAFRFEIGRAMLRGRKPLLCMTKFRKKEPDMVEHEMAEPCAGGGVLFVKTVSFEKRPDLLRLVHNYFELRHQHRAIFANHGKRRHCQVALLYSVPTMLYRHYMAAVAAPPVSAMSGMARAFEEGHIPFDVAILNHPEIHSDYVTLDDLKRYRLLVLPELECLSNAQVEKISQYLDAGGSVGIIGKAGVRDENNRPRESSPVDGWRGRGRVIDMTPDPYFGKNRASESDRAFATTSAVLSATRQALDDDLIVQGDLPRLLWVKTWAHDCGVVSLHFVNYDIDFESAQATPTEPVRVTVRLPAGIEPAEAQFIVPGKEPQALEIGRAGPNASFLLPSVRVYGVVLIGKRGLDRAASDIALGDALAARAKDAADGEWGGLADRAASVERARPASDSSEQAAEVYARTAEQLLADTSAAQDAAYVANVTAMADTDGAVLALDFGGRQAEEGWQIVAKDAAYDGSRGWGWLPHQDRTEPTPEELHYSMASRYGTQIPLSTQEGYAIFWPYRPLPPAPVYRCLCSGRPSRFRIDIENGSYEVRVVTINPSWYMRNFLVSGMVRANGVPVLLDAVHGKGSIVGRSFTSEVTDGRLDLTFGGPTGWGVAAIVVKPVADPRPDPLAIGAIREWKISPRFANPDWYPIQQTRAVAERNAARPDTADWTTVRAASEGLGLVDLGTNRDMDAGDVVYAVATIDSERTRTARLSLGASSSAMAWLNGQQIAYLPNQKGVLRDECVAPIELKRGPNVLMLKLCRFWERQWQFYVSVLGQQ